MAYVCRLTRKTPYSQVAVSSSNSKVFFLRRLRWRGSPWALQNVLGSSRSGSSGNRDTDVKGEGDEFQCCMKCERKNAAFPNRYFMYDEVCVSNTSRRESGRLAR